MGGGGYVAGPVGLRPLTPRIPLVLTEADSHLGLTNRMLAPFARRVCLAFPDRGAQRGPLPASPDGRSRRRTRDRAARARGSASARGALRAVFGGSLGARSINLAAVEGLPGNRFACCACGRRDPYAELAAHDPRPAMTCASTSISRVTGRSPPPTWRSRAPAARCSRSRRRPAGDPRALSARLRRSPERQRALDGRRRAPR